MQFSGHPASEPFCRWIVAWFYYGSWNVCMEWGRELVEAPQRVIRRPGRVPLPLACPGETGASNLVPQYCRAGVLARDFV